MKHAVMGLLVLPFLSTGAFAADRLSDPQLDVVTAGQVLGIVNCGGCTLSSSTSSSSNGVTTSTSSNSVVGGGSGGGTSGGSGGGTAGGGSTAPTVGTSIPIPVRQAAILAAASVVMVTPSIR
jgi:hypothetical protein